MLTYSCDLKIATYPGETDEILSEHNSLSQEREARLLPINYWAFLVFPAVRILGETCT